MDLPLKGLKVLDLTRALSGPFCTMILADLGAEVIKVEPTPDGDMIRQWGPFDHGISVYYLSANRNKKGVGVDFRHPDGLPLLRRLALRSDIVVENFRVGTAEKMGLGYEALAAEHPGLIYASISGFGNRGPARDWAGFDQIAQGYSGFMSLSGTPETGPMRVGTAVGDLTSGMWAAIGVLGACVARQQTGLGRYVHSSLLSSLMGLLSVQGQRYLSLGEVPQPCGNVHPVIAPYGTFQTADGPLNLAPATQDMWLRLCELLGCPELTEDPRFRLNADRIRHRLELKELIDARPPRRRAATRRPGWPRCNAPPPGLRARARHARCRRSGRRAKSGTPGRNPAPHPPDRRSGSPAAVPSGSGRWPRNGWRPARPECRPPAGPGTAPAPAAPRR